MSHFFKIAATCIASLSLSVAANATCMNSTYCTSNQSMSYAAAGHPSNGTPYLATSNYQASSVQTYGFSGSQTTIPGLGQNETLRARACPTNVHNPEGGKVLGCYDVVKPVPQTNYYRVVRPIIYVRYPVPVAVPYYAQGHCQSARASLTLGQAHYGNMGRCR